MSCKKKHQYSSISKNKNSHLDNLPPGAFVCKERHREGDSAKNGIIVSVTVPVILLFPAGRLFRAVR